jgi:magnesium chelatase family protein
MPIIRLSSACKSGLKSLLVTIEVGIQRGLPHFEIIGLADRIIQESKARIRSAIKNSGFTFPLGKVTVSLLPADVTKGGGSLDLAIAVGILAASKQIPHPREPLVLLGELDLAGNVKSPAGLEKIIQEIGFVDKTVLPKDMVGKEYCQPTVPCLFVDTLISATQGLRLSKQWIVPSSTQQTKTPPIDFLIDHLVGLEHAKRAAVVAMAGGHHFWVKGPPGIGKTRLIEAAVQLVTNMGGHEEVNSQKIEIPFRKPYPSQSAGEIFGSKYRLGELSLAARGVIFFDELPAFRKAVLEGLRGPLEERKIGDLPIADCVCAAQNLCPCGKRGVPGESCLCKASSLRRYFEKVSFPLRERFDIQCDIPYVYPQEWCEQVKPELKTGESLRGKIYQARVLQTRRNNKGLLNGAVRDRDELWGWLDKSGKSMIKKIGAQCLGSPRSLVAIVRVARTVADLEGLEYINEGHISEAYQYRSPILTEGKNLA